MPAERSSPKPAITPTPAKATASRWITPAQHAELIALMAADPGYSVHITGLPNIVQYKKTFSDSGNNQSYNIVGISGAEGTWACSGPIQIVSGQGTGTVTLQPTGLSTRVADAKLTFVVGGTTIAQAYITVIRPDHVQRNTISFDPSMHHLWGYAALVIYDQLTPARVFPNNVSVGETLTDEHKSANVNSGTTRTGSGNTGDGGPGASKDTWAFEASDMSGAWIDAKQALTIGDWTTAATHVEMGTNEFTTPYWSFDSNPAPFS